MPLENEECKTQETAMEDEDLGHRSSCRRPLPRAGSHAGVYLPREEGRHRLLGLRFENPLSRLHHSVTRHLNGPDV